MASIITGIFKKSKNGRQLVEALVDHLDALPSKNKVVMVAQKKAEENQLEQRTASAKNLTEMASDTTVGVADGLSAEDIAALDGIEKRLSDIRALLVGTSDSTPKEDDSIALAKELIDANIPLRLLTNLQTVPFEARKDIVTIVNYLLGYNKNQLGSYTSTTSVPEEMKNNSKDAVELTELISNYFSRIAESVVLCLLAGFSQDNLALHCGAVLRQSLLHRSLYEECLKPAVLDLFFTDFLHSESFDVCSDAFATFRDILSKRKQLVGLYLKNNYASFFSQYNKLLKSDMQYVTQRQSLKLLSELLLDRQNFKIMIAYIGDKNNLILIMNLMRVKSPAMRLEAFHVFKIFVANPSKTEAVTQILAKNRSKLITYLANFTTEREDTTFNSERQLLINTLEGLQDPSEVEKVAEGLQQTSIQVPQSSAQGSGQPVAAVAEATSPASQNPKAEVAAAAPGSKE